MIATGRWDFGVPEPNVNSGYAGRDCSATRATLVDRCADLIVPGYLPFVTCCFTSDMQCFTPEMGIDGIVLVCRAVGAYPGAFEVGRDVLIAVVRLRISGSGSLCLCACHL